MVRGHQLTFVLKVLIAAGGAAILGDAASASVPPHPPGSICYTPSGWCPAQPAGAPGTPCVCVTPRGPMGGVRN